MLGAFVSSIGNVFVLKEVILEAILFIEWKKVSKGGLSLYIPY